MTMVGGPHEVRDAGLIASFQRILHYRIAGYGTVAAYARALGETYHGGALAGFADRDKEVDAQLSDLAQTIINPAAAQADAADRKSTRLNSSHANISYAVFCLKKKQHKLHPHNHHSSLALPIYT